MSDQRSSGIGAHVLRVEDERLITGRGTYTDDINLPNQACAAIVRSPHAHARIVGIDTGEARALPGVLSVLTGADAVADQLGPMLHENGVLGDRAAQMRGPDVYLQDRRGENPFLPPQYLLPTDRVRFVGEAVAVVIAETQLAARQAAEMVVVDYEPLPCVVSAMDAAEPGAPLVWDHVDRNLSLEAEAGNKQATDEAFARADHIVSLDTAIQRITGVPMEPRAAIGDYDAATGKYTLYTGCSNVYRFKLEMAAVLKVPRDKVRVISKDVGGSFGTRNPFYPEDGLVIWAAGKLGRPVKFLSDRSECFLSDYQGRDLAVQIELALDKSGRFLALRGVNTSNIGAHAVSHSPLRKGVSLMSGMYDIQAAHFIARAVFTNTMPTNPVRSSGRPEAMFVIERLIDLAALELGMDRAEIRRRNLIRSEQFPYRNPLGLVYDNGEYKACMDEALRRSKWESFAARRAESASRGKLRGISVANYVEITSGPPTERADLRVTEDGLVELAIGTVSSGQGHATSFAQLLNAWLGVPIESVKLLEGDTDKISIGGGSVAGRSMRMGSVVIEKASKELVVRASRIVGHLHGVGVEMVTFRDGTFRLGDRDLGVTVFDVAREARQRNDLPDELRGPLTGSCQETITVAGFPHGTQVCEVEIDPLTGEIEIKAFTAIDDVGLAVSPMIVHGQTHGGAVMGIGQALMENIVYSTDDGQLSSGSFMDYAMPRAADVPFIQTSLSEVRAPGNPLGVRAASEGGVTPALAVTVSAVVDAVSHLGIKHFDMPVTSMKVWSALQQTKSAKKSPLSA